MSFRCPARCVAIALTVVALCLPGCRCNQGGRAQISIGTFWPIKKPARKVRVRTSEPSQMNSNSSGSGGTWQNNLPSPDPKFNERPLVVPAPEPYSVPSEGEPAIENPDPMSVPLPSPPRLPTRAGITPPRALPPLPELPDVLDDAPEPQQTRTPPDFRGFSTPPDFSPQPEFSPVPRQSQAPSVPRVAERLERSRQPVQLQAPETDLPPEPINTEEMTPEQIEADPFDEEPQTERGRTPFNAFPEPTDDEEDLDLTPATIPDSAESPIEKQSLEIGNYRPTNLKSIKSNSTLEKPSRPLVSKPASKPKTISEASRKIRGLRVPPEKIVSKKTVTASR